MKAYGDSSSSVLLLKESAACIQLLQELDQNSIPGDQTIYRNEDKVSDLAFYLHRSSLRLISNHHGNGYNHLL